MALGAGTVTWNWTGSSLSRYFAGDDGSRQTFAAFPLLKGRVLSSTKDAPASLLKTTGTATALGDGDGA